MTVHVASLGTLCHLKHCCAAAAGLVIRALANACLIMRVSCCVPTGVLLHALRAAAADCGEQFSSIGTFSWDL